MSAFDICESFAREHGILATPLQLVDGAVFSCRLTDAQRLELERELGAWLRS
jgi:hypothetical protein